MARLGAAAAMAEGLSVDRQVVLDRLLTFPMP